MKVKVIDVAEKTESYRKYNTAKKEDRTYKDIVFASIAEMDRYIFLEALQRAGKISGLERQPRYEIIAKGERNKKHDYTPDFQYMENGKLVVEEVKGVFTEAYCLRRSLFLQKYPYEFREIHNKKVTVYEAAEPEGGGGK